MMIGSTLTVPKIQKQYQEVPFRERLHGALYTWLFSYDVCFAKQMQYLDSLSDFAASNLADILHFLTVTKINTISRLA